MDWGCSFSVLPAIRTAVRVGIRRETRLFRQMFALRETHN